MQQLITTAIVWIGASSFYEEGNRDSGANGSLTHESKDDEQRRQVLRRCDEI